MTEPLSLEQVNKIRLSAARKVAGRFHGYVPFEDMLQQAHLATLEHPRKFQEHVDAGDEKRLHWMVYKTCSMYAQRQKAAILGYRVEDLYFYSLRTLRKIVPLVLEAMESSELPTDADAWLDVSEALQGLSGADFQLVWWAFRGDPEEEAGYQNVADHLSISVAAARGRIDRVLRRLQEALGGENPAPRRKRKSNASALAETRNAWDGEA